MCAAGLVVRCWLNVCLLLAQACVCAAGSVGRARCRLRGVCMLPAQAWVCAAHICMLARSFAAGSRVCSLQAQACLCAAGLVMRARCRLSWACSLLAWLCVLTAQLCVLAAGSVVCAGMRGAIAMQGCSNASACAEAMPATVPLNLRLGFGTLTFLSHLGSHLLPRLGLLT